LRALRRNFRDAAGGWLSGDLLGENRDGKKNEYEKERAAGVRVVPRREWKEKGSRGESVHEVHENEMLA